MDVSIKIRELRADIDSISDQEKVIKSRIQELKMIVEEKKKREANLVDLKKQEAELMKELGLI
jgi:hypothetical protein